MTSRYRIPGTELTIAFGDGTVIVRPVDLSPTQWTILREAEAARRLGHRSYVVPQKVVCQKAMRLLLKMELLRPSTRFGQRSVAITPFGRRVLGLPVPGERPKLRVVRGGKR